MPQGAWFGRLKTFRRRLRTRLPLRCLLVCWVGAIIRFHSTGLGPMGGIFLRHTSPFRHPCRDKFGGGFAAGFWEGGSQASLEPGPASRPVSTRGGAQALPGSSPPLKNEFRPDGVSPPAFGKAPLELRSGPGQPRRLVSNIILSSLAAYSSAIFAGHLGSNAMTWGP